ncbi:EAL domain-containing protein [Psychrobacillus sp. BM2]|uniref:bifunctional diguanylate cyclase/phosphodiesterase n=1 Tax=Psychrobacillus sp. BM2 TaxID=3400421 RepID=UPI003B02DEB5
MENIFNFNNDSPVSNSYIEITGDYSMIIVAISVIIAVVASYTALSLNRRARENSFFHKNFWLLLASICLGFGIWSMHFVGMGAFSLPVNMGYNNIITLISIIPAMLASFIAFYLANLPRRNIWSYIFAGIAMGTGISSMHYIGMYAMEMDVVYTYDRLLFIASICIAIIVSVIAVYIFSKVQTYKTHYIIQLLISLIMGLAISSMHYTGMAAMHFYIPEGYELHKGHSHMTEMYGLAIIVTLGMAVLLGISLLSSLIDRYIEYRANYYDALTQLPNRRLFEKKLQTPKVLAVWHIHDLEYINREFSYAFGDDVIRALVLIFKSRTPSKTEIYRIEGHRIALVARDVDSAKQLIDDLKEIADVLRQPILVKDQEVFSYGVCAISEADQFDNAPNIYTNVLAVLNYPSITYNHNIVYYDPSVHTYTFEREIAEDVIRAMREDELFLVYQPKVRLTLQNIAGLEALLRWNHPKYGVLSPAVFIPILEEYDRMISVTNWIIDRVCQQMANWQQENISFKQVAINIPGEYVTSPLLLKVLKQKLNDYGLEPTQVELEITENSFVKNMEEAMRSVGAFRREGFSVALDDFGTGVSSLSYLKQMPISTLKIDKSFIDDVPISPKDSAIVQAIITLGESLNLNIVIEGVEKKEQVDFLTNTSEDPIFQGYYFAKPMKPHDLIKWYREARVED